VFAVRFLSHGGSCGPQMTKAGKQPTVRSRRLHAGKQPRERENRRQTMERARKTRQRPADSGNSPQSAKAAHDKESSTQTAETPHNWQGKQLRNSFCVPRWCQSQKCDGASRGQVWLLHYFPLDLHGQCCACVCIISMCSALWLFVK
jgi:hypothetical protein